MKVTFLILLCLVGFLLLPICAGTSSLHVSSNLNLCSLGIDWNPVSRNVTGTGTLTVNDTGVTIVCDNGEAYTNYYDGHVTVVNPDTRRVAFTIGILNYTGIVHFPEDLFQTFVIYQMQELPNNADFISASKLFGATQKAVTLSPVDGPVITGLMSRKSVYGLDYNASYDLNGDGIINMRDIAMAITNCEKLANTLT